MNPLAPVLTIDGPSGAGKGTISRIIARRMGWHYLDSGALYRAVGVAASWADIDTSDASALVRCTFDTHVQFVEQGQHAVAVLRQTCDQVLLGAEFFRNPCEKVLAGGFTLSVDLSDASLHVLRQRQIVDFF